MRNMMGCSLNTSSSVPEGIVDVDDVVGRSVIVVVVAVVVAAAVVVVNFVVVVAAAVAAEGVNVVFCVDAT